MNCHYLHIITITVANSPAMSEHYCYYYCYFTSYFEKLAICCSLASAVGREDYCFHYLDYFGCFGCLSRRRCLMYLSSTVGCRGRPFTTRVRDFIVADSDFDSGDEHPCWLP